MCPNYFAFCPQSSKLLLHCAHCIGLVQAAVMPKSASCHWWDHFDDQVVVALAVLSSKSPLSFLAFSIAGGIWWLSFWCQRKVAKAEF
jgi:hypothetical protein